MLRDYYAHVIKYPETLLTRFFGLHRVKPHGGRNVRFVVMGNLLCTGHAIHRRYDLKGSTYGRLTRAPYDPAKKILKDLDLDYTYQLDEGYAARLAAQLSADCTLLERLNIMDYSLLLGVHIQQKPVGCDARNRMPFVLRVLTFARAGRRRASAAARLEGLRRASRRLTMVRRRTTTMTLTAKPTCILGKTCPRWPSLGAS